jgi:hypothetical protein
MRKKTERNAKPMQRLQTDGTYLANESLKQHKVLIMNVTYVLERPSSARLAEGFLPPGFGIHVHIVQGKSPDKMSNESR